MHRYLKLLAVLANLQDFVSNNDGLFGLFGSEADKFPDSLIEAKAKIREKRWAVYTARGQPVYRMAVYLSAYATATDHDKRS